MLCELLLAEASLDHDALWIHLCRVESSALMYCSATLKKSGSHMA